MTNLDLPKKDENGISYISYSQIQLFKKDREEYHQRYILSQKFEGNAYTDFGSKVGKALETGDYNSFSTREITTLKKCERLDEFEKRVKINFEGFYVLGFIDTISKDYSKIIDYKTGGANKEYQYNKEEYTQLCYYALAIRQEFGITPKTAQVNFIRRKGNAFKGENLTVGNEVKIIDVDITYNRLKKVYWEIITVANQIESFYKLYKL